MRLTQLFPQRLFGIGVPVRRSILRALNVLSTNSERATAASPISTPLRMNAP